MSESALRDRLSLLAHEGMPMMNPLARDDVASLLDALPLARGDRALDLGGGRGDLAAMLAERGVATTSVDCSALLGDVARARGLDAITGDARAYLDETLPRDLALAACLGATHALGGAAEAVRTLIEIVRPGGAILIGDLVLDDAAPDRWREELGADAESTLRAPLASHRVVADHVIRDLDPYERAWAASAGRAVTREPALAPILEARLRWMDELRREGGAARLRFVALAVLTCA